MACKPASFRALIWGTLATILCALSSESHGGESDLLKKAIGDKVTVLTKDSKTITGLLTDVRDDGARLGAIKLSVRDLRGGTHFASYSNTAIREVRRGNERLFPISQAAAGLRSKSQDKLQDLEKRDEIEKQSRLQAAQKARDQATRTGSQAGTGTGTSQRVDNSRIGVHPDPMLRDAATRLKPLARSVMSSAGPPNGGVPINELLDELSTRIAESGVDVSVSRNAVAIVKTDGMTAGGILIRIDRAAAVPSTSTLSFVNKNAPHEGVTRVQLKEVALLGYGPIICRLSKDTFEIHETNVRGAWVEPNNPQSGTYLINQLGPIVWARRQVLGKDDNLTGFLTGDRIGFEVESENGVYYQIGGVANQQIQLNRTDGTGKGAVVLVPKQPGIAAALFVYLVNEYGERIAVWTIKRACVRVLHKHDRQIVEDAVDYAVVIYKSKGMDELSAGLLENYIKGRYPAASRSIDLAKLAKVVVDEMKKKH